MSVTGFTEQEILNRVFDASNNVLGTSGGAGLPTQTGQNGKYLTTNGSAASWGTVSAVVAYAQTLVVALSGGDYTTITAALAAITDATTSKRYCIKVMPGTYAEAITMKAYVDLVGVDRDSCIIQQADANVVTLASNSTIAHLTVRVTATSAARNLLSTLVTISNCTIDDCYLYTDNAAYNHEAISLANYDQAVTNLIVKNCRMVHTNTTGAPQAIFFISNNYGENGIIDNCDITWKNGVRLQSYDNTATDLITIKNCRINSLASSNNAFFVLAQGASSIAHVVLLGTSTLNGQGYIQAANGNTAALDAYSSSLYSVAKAGSGGTETFNSYLSTIGTTPSFGAYTAGVAVASTGYITVIDSTGTSRKVMVQA